MRRRSEAVRRSTASAITAGDGGSGIDEADARARAGVRASVWLSDSSAAGFVTRRLRGLGATARVSPSEVAVVLAPPVEVDGVVVVVVVLVVACWLSRLTGEPEECEARV